MRRAARKDDNKDAVVAALQEIGCTVYDLRQPVDLLVWSPWIGIMLIEIKDGAKPPSQRRHTDAQKRFIGSWPGPVFTVHSPAHAVASARPIEAPLETFADMVEKR